jgi:hypothetical protein
MLRNLFLCIISLAIIKDSFYRVNIGCAAGTPGVYAKVASFIPWIEEHM